MIYEQDVQLMPRLGILYFVQSPVIDAATSLISMTRFGSVLSVGDFVLCP